MTEEFRRAPRRKVSDNVPVIDTMTDRTVGRLSNVSETGMLLIANVPLVEDALYQFRFNIGDPKDPGAAIEVGAHLLWQDAAHASEQTWTGFRFITLLEDQMQQLREWLQAPDGSYE
ncbi:PilZ domain-containing protein [Lysobacter sp. D1-1-M9]|uniref:PilZ domain-containing protein n=1 Tax=Novilysobacter longmucuonensis TaxID=3098603 RepID=UPI002FC9074C